MIDNDLKTIESLQNEFKRKHGTYFEMDWLEQKISVPTKGDKLSLQKIKRFVKTGSLKTHPNPEIIGRACIF